MKTIFSLLLTLTLALNLYSQQVIFCEDVDKTGNPISVSKEFAVGKNGGFVKILVRLNKKVESHSVIFDVYKINEGKESLENSLSMEVFPVLTWFYKEITFYKEGNYRIYVYDEKDKMLGIGELRINVK